MERKNELGMDFLLKAMEATPETRIIPDEAIDGIIGKLSGAEFLWISGVDLKARYTIAEIRFRDALNEGRLSAETKYRLEALMNVFSPPEQENDEVLI